MDEKDARDEAEFVSAAAKLMSIKLPSDPVVTTYALLYVAAMKAPDDGDLFLAAANEAFDRAKGVGVDTA